MVQSRLELLQVAISDSKWVQVVTREKVLNQEWRVIGFKFTVAIGQQELIR